MRYATLSVPRKWDLPFWSDEWPTLAAWLDEQPDVLPPAHQTFAALEAVAPDDVHVVILGQDPYPTPGHAHGLAFSVTDETPLPRSLKNIYKELEDDLNVLPLTGNLNHWAAQGLLLLNTALTVPAGDAGGHKGRWSSLTAQVLKRLRDAPRAYVLWGGHAQKMLPDDPPGLVLRTAHPSPLSARRGFFGSKPFSKVNSWLETQGEQPIDWGPAGKEHT